MANTYQTLNVVDVDPDEPPQEGGVMIHVVPENPHAHRWNHVEDLDCFFSAVYEYHQKSGFKCMMLEKVGELFRFAFLVFFLTYSWKCIDYDIVFGNKLPPGITINNASKVSIYDSFMSLGQCSSQIPLWLWVFDFLMLLIWLWLVFKAVYRIYQFLDIQAFYNIALKISDNDLQNITWHDVLTKLIETQRVQQMCVHKKELTPLDIYQRILRYDNYTVALVNKALLPPQLEIPLIGNVIFFTQDLKLNLDLLFFYGPFAFFDEWHLKPDYKKSNKRLELAKQLDKHLTYFAIVNLTLAPLTIFWHFILIALNHVQEIKQNPGLFTLRHWSLYSTYYLRHFNELDHELSARLTRAWRPASRYMSSFTSPVLAVVAKNFIFISSAGLAVLLLWTIIDNSVSQLEEVLTSVLVLTSVIVILKAFIPDENLVWCPEDLMTIILKQIHYCPTWWKGQAHTTRVRDEFSQLFQYKIVYVLQQLCSPLVTPYILYFHMKPKSLEIVDFFRNFTVEVMGVGDVCSFAQMDVKKHGSPLWQMTEAPAASSSNIPNQAEGGKTELSLMHFTQTNPYWKPPTEEAQNFVSMVKNEAKKELISTMYGDNPDNTSFMSSYGININSVYAGPSQPTARPLPVHMNISRMEGPPAPPHSINPLPTFPFGDISQEVSGIVGMSGGDDMSISALYLHELHHRHAGTSGLDASSSLFRSRYQPQERTPLLQQDKHS
ncbi:hypothetical protein WDU94_012740 [Cyamophila willieti]